MSKPNKTVQAACDQLIELVKLERARFTKPGTHMDDCTDEVRVYMRTWVVPLLEAIQDGDTQRLKRLLR